MPIEYESLKEVYEAEKLYKDLQRLAARAVLRTKQTTYCIECAQSIRLISDFLQDDRLCANCRQKDCLGD